MMQYSGSELSMALSQRRDPLPPIARAPDVQDLLELLDLYWFGSSKPIIVEEQNISPPQLRSGSGASLSQATTTANSENNGSRNSLQLQVEVDEYTPVANATPPEEVKPSSRGWLNWARYAQSTSIEPENGLGTWANRQKIFDTAAQDDYHTDRSKFKPSPFVLTHEYSPIDTQRANYEEEESEVLDLSLPPTADSIEQAWKWRFTRRWHAEQLKQQEEPTKDNEEDDWVAALDYMATAGGAHLQFARAISLDRNASFEAGLSQSMSLLLIDEASLPTDASLRQSAPDTPMATRLINKTVKRAEQLMAHQKQIEQAVKERWESTSSQEPWAGHRVPAVKIDSWGQFSFILARVLDTSNGRQKLLLRGSNRSNVDQSSRELQQEIIREAKTQGLPAPRVDVLGSGSMEWCRDRDRCLNIFGTVLYGVIDSRLSRKEDVANVAAALAQTGLTALHKVNVLK